jgi:hypothetical protein
LQRGAHVDMACATPWSPCSCQIALMRCGDHFEMARAIISSLCACQIALAVARRWFCPRELAQGSWHGISHWHLAKGSLLETSYRDLVLVQRSLTEILRGYLW